MNLFKWRDLTFASTWREGNCCIMMKINAIILECNVGRNTSLNVLDESEIYLTKALQKSRDLQQNASAILQS